MVSFWRTNHGDQSELFRFNLYSLSLASVAFILSIHVHAKRSVCYKTRASVYVVRQLLWVLYGMGSDTI
jgi:uncharacterized membrane protein